MIRVLTLGAVVVATTLSTGCVWPFMRGVLPENTPARALSAYAEPSSQPLGSFRNLSHPTISVNWARKKSDGQEKGDNRLTKALGINWFPVYSGAPDSLVADAQAEKQFVCGRAETAGLFIGVKPTREFDWNFLLDPDEELFVDTGTLQKSALRVAQSRALDFRKIAEKSGEVVQHAILALEPRQHTSSHRGRGVPAASPPSTDGAVSLPRGPLRVDARPAHPRPAPAGNAIARAPLRVRAVDTGGVAWIPP